MLWWQQGFLGSTSDCGRAGDGAGSGVGRALEGCAAGGARAVDLQWTGLEKLQGKQGLLTRRDLWTRTEVPVTALLGRRPNGPRCAVGGR